VVSLPFPHKVGHLFVPAILCVVYALQIAVIAGCHVLVTSSSRDKIDRAVRLGAVAGFDYTKDGWDKEVADFVRKRQRNHENPGVAVVIDGAGGDSVNLFLRFVKFGGRIVSYGATAGLCNSLNLYALFLKNICLMGSSMGSDEDFRRMLAFVEEHRLRPLIDEVYKFDNIESAFEKMTERSQFGKIVVTMDDSVSSSSPASSGGRPQTLKAKL